MRNYSRSVSSCIRIALVLVFSVLQLDSSDRLWKIKGGVIVLYCPCVERNGSAFYISRQRRLSSADFSCSCNVHLQP